MQKSLKRSDDNRLSKEQTHGIALLSVGTFLEYFDFMLHVHLAVVLNDLFFPKGDPKWDACIPALTFSSNFIFRPFGGLLFGYIGDLVGRKVTIILTTVLIAICCITVASLPTYAQIGILAPILLTACRAIQNMSVSAEVVGVELYVTESVKDVRQQYKIITLITAIMSLGGMTALGAGYIATSNLLYKSHPNNAWRFAFLLGALIGVIGAVGRTALREASEFANRGKAIKEKFEKADLNIRIQYPKTQISTSLAYFGIRCGGPACFYLLYIWCGEILKNTFGFTPNQVLVNNFWVTFVDTVGLVIIAYLSYYICPLKIIRAKLLLFFTFLVLFLILMHTSPSPKVVFYFQCASCLVTFDQAPANSLFFKYFPVMTRFRYVGIINAVASAMTVSLISIGTVLATKEFGNAGVLLIFIPLGLIFTLSLIHFEQNEKNLKNAEFGKLSSELL